ncbi:hypothetical protein MSPP1_003762 [Malassezia sp. CBS 17886]|nr:hypothetical protein MSPP1_003762 [Malassezia sp. CBS 17886]
MAPAIEAVRQVDATSFAKEAAKRNTKAHAEPKLSREPQTPSGLLDSLYKYDELTPAIGRVYPEVQLRDLIHHERADEILRDVAITISRRGVVFFKDQDLTPDEQKFFTGRISELAGKPPTSGMHIHPVLNAERSEEQLAIDEKGTANEDNEISVISSKLDTTLEVGMRSGKWEWHSDICFEPVPSDYTSLKVHTLPETGGDTLWSSGYELYDLLSPAFQQFADGLQAHFRPPLFHASARKFGYKLHEGPRGAPENVGTHLSAEHPFVRTNPVTGWKSVYGSGHHFNRVLNVTPDESDLINLHVTNLITQNHATQVRWRWGKNDLAIWDNRSTYHAATPDYKELGPRAGVRAVALGERPYFDPASVSRKTDLKGRID